MYHKISVFVGENMIRGLYISASAAVSESKRIDIIANNMANVNTTGYKKDLMLTQDFPEILISKINGRIDKDIMGARSSKAGIESESNGETYTATTPTGYFNVETPLGISKSKSIGFNVNKEGFLVTPQGSYILGQKGRINTGGAAVSVDATGQVLAGGTAVDRLKVSNPLNVLGHLSYGIHSGEVRTNYEQGQLQRTESSLDFALSGKGFFCIETPQGERYTRNGEFTKDAEGYLVTKEGYKVLGEGGYISIEGSNVIVNGKGEVYKDEQMIDKLKLVDFDDYKILRKEGDGLLKIEEGIEEGPVAASVLVQQGFVEGSNVNSVKEMVEMLTMMRTYEANQKLITMHDGLLEKAVNNIARV